MLNNKLANRLLNMREEIESAKVEKNREEGKLEEFLKQIKKRFGCENERAASKVIDKMEAEIEKDNEVFERGVNRLEDNYEW